MLLDQFLPDYDTTIIEHIVVDAPPGVVFRTIRDLDFAEIDYPMVEALMSVRELPRKLRGRFGGPGRGPTPPPTMRLRDLFDESEPSTAGGPLNEWLALGQVPDRELVFGAIGKIWQPTIEWRPVPPDSFRGFADPDYAKIAAGFSVRSYGADRTLLSYEARTAGTDGQARRKFLRYWWLVRRFVRPVMRGAVVAVKDRAERTSGSQTSNGAIFVSGKYGTTEEYANWISDATGLPVFSIDDRGADPTDFDYLVLGSSVIYFRLSIRRWIKRHRDSILRRPTVLFTVSGAPAGAKLDRWIDRSLPEPLRAHVDHVALQGRQRPAELTRFDRTMLIIGSWFNRDPEARDQELRGFDFVDRATIGPVVDRIRELDTAVDRGASLSTS